MRLISAIQDSGLLDGAALDELGESFLSHQQVNPRGRPPERLLREELHGARAERDRAA